MRDCIVFSALGRENANALSLGLSPVPGDPLDPFVIGQRAAFRSSAAILR